MKKWAIIIILVVNAGCAPRQRQLDYFSQLLCTCGEPVVAWKQELPANPGSISKGGEIEMQLRDCLGEGTSQFQELSTDTAFVYELAATINRQCPEINTSVNAMLLILAGEK